MLWQHEKEYHEVIAAAKGTEVEKRLAPQFIAEFFKYFPNLAERATAALHDLCKDGNIEIRCQAIGYLPWLCKDTKEHTPRIGNILAQLLIVDNQLELQQVHVSFHRILTLDAKGALTGVVSEKKNQFSKWFCFYLSHCEVGKFSPQNPIAVHSNFSWW